MAEAQLFFIGTSKKKEIRHTGVPTYNWGTYGSWTKFKTPSQKSKKNVKYNKTTKNKAGKSSGAKAGGGTHYGTAIPATKTITIDGYPVTVDVRYFQRGYTLYTRTKALTKKKKMIKTVYDNGSHPYQYRIQLKDKVTYETAYSEYVDGVEYIYFADEYFIGGVSYPTNGHLPHPVEVSFSYSDVRKNFESSANNSENRDNKGKYILTNVRANVLTINLVWRGLAGEEGADLLDTLNPEGGKNYLIVQYRDPVTQKAKNGTFFADSRTVEKYSNGIFKEITVTLTEV